MMGQNVPDLSKIAPFSALPSTARRYLQSRLRSYDFKAGQPIIQYGKRGSFCAIIESGVVELLEANGDRRVLGPGQTFGEGMLRFGVPSAFAAVAQVETTLWVIKRTDWVFASELPPDRIELQELSEPEQEAGLLLEQEVAPQKIKRARRINLWPLAILSGLVLALIILYPELPQYVNRMVMQAALNAGRPDLAERFLNLSLYWLPNSAQVFDSLGYSLYLQDKNAKALDAFQQAVTYDEMNAAAQNNLGVMLLNQSEAGQALDHFKAAVDLDPGDAKIYLNMGNAYLAAGELEAGAGAYQRAFEIDPNLVDAKALWAGIMLEQGETAKAKQAWREVLELDAEHPLALRGLGVAAVMEDDPQQALIDLQNALAVDPQDAITHFYLGMALEALDRPEEAAAAFTNALSLSDDPAIADLAQAHLKAIQKSEPPR
jgi:tetratricopeptide (TPR) repeat protein